MRRPLLIILTLAAAGLMGAAPANAAPGLDQIAISSLAHEDGTSKTQAARKLATQRTSMVLAEKLGAQLPATVLGGFYLDRSSGRLIANVRDEATAEVVRHAGGQPRFVRHSLAELESVQAWLSNTAVGIGSIYVEVEENVVVVVPSRAADARLVELVKLSGGRAEIRAGAGHEGRLTAATVWAGGTKVYNSYGACTAGFAARDSSNNRYMITAAHCVPWHATYFSIGDYKFGDRWHYNPDYDEASVRNGWPGYWDQVPRVARWDATSVVVKGHGIVSKNHYVCKSGVISYWTCGYVEITGLAKQYETGGPTYYNLTQVKMCARPGDSGGPVVFASGGQYYATGTLSGGSATTSCWSEARSWFQPIGATLSRTGLALITG